MYKTTITKKDLNHIVIHLDLTKIARGHQIHRAGAGVHGDRRTKRNRTRGNRNRTAIRDWR